MNNSFTKFSEYPNCNFDQAIFTKNFRRQFTDFYRVLILTLKFRSKLNNFYLQQRLRQMSEHRLSPKNSHKKKSPCNREGDWICQLCNNYNYSFRMKCNRCQVQAKECNQTITIFYDENSYYVSEIPPMAREPTQFVIWNQQKEKCFPNVLFLQLDDEPWHITRQDIHSRRDPFEVQNLGWINQLIAD